MSTITKQPNQATVQETINKLIVDSIEDIKGKRIVKMDLRRLPDSPTDFFIVCEADSTTQVKAISDRISYRLKTELAEIPNHIEGTRESRWICLDYFTTVIHVFHKEAREFYQLEELWSDADITEYESL